MLNISKSHSHVMQVYSKEPKQIWKKLCVIHHDFAIQTKNLYCAVLPLKTHSSKDFCLDNMKTKCCVVMNASFLTVYEVAFV